MVARRSSSLPRTRGDRPLATWRIVQRRGLPRTRGDRPRHASRPRLHVLSPPHARGSTLRGTECPAVPRQSPPHARGSTLRILTSRAGRWMSPPHARGSTLPVAWRVSERHVSPARAGIDPSYERVDARCPMSPPHARGSTLLTRASAVVAELVSPARAGIDPPACDAGMSRACGLPRTRGDRPRMSSPSEAPRRSPPHARGSTLAGPGEARRVDSLPRTRGDRPAFGTPDTAVGHVSPARAGIDPGRTDSAHRRHASPPHARGSTLVWSRGGGARLSLPRTRGDRPVHRHRAIPAAQVSPARAGIDPVHAKRSRRGRHVSPARAGIDPWRVWMLGSWRCLPRTRGDRPQCGPQAATAPSLPRTRGDRPWRRRLRPGRGGLPRTRGDRRAMTRPPSSCGRSPPHARGSTRALFALENHGLVSPARAGIDRGRDTNCSPRRRLPRTRGDRPSPIRPSPP